MENVVFAVEHQKQYATFSGTVYTFNLCGQVSQTLLHIIIERRKPDFFLFGVIKDVKRIGLNILILLTKNIYR